MSYSRFPLRVPWRTLLVCAGCLLQSGQALAAPDDDGGVRRVVRETRAIYPPLAKQMHISGTVQMQVTVLPDGSVGAVTKTSGHPLLFRAAEDAVRHWRFAPARESSSATVNVVFTP